MQQHIYIFFLSTNRFKKMLAVCFTQEHINYMYIDTQAVLCGSSSRRFPLQSFMCIVLSPSRQFPHMRHYRTFTANTHTDQTPLQHIVQLIGCWHIYVHLHSLQTKPRDKTTQCREEMLKTWWALMRDKTLLCTYSCLAFCSGVRSRLVLECALVICFVCASRSV